jgi:Family of unknown function (DUF5946)
LFDDDEELATEHKKRMKFVPCIGCAGLFPDIEGATHRYMESSAGCWATYGEVLAREYGDPKYFETHRLTVDTYAAQHPGRPSPQSIKSVGYHLVRLCLILERGLKMELANEAMLVITKTKDQFTWLTPPSSLGLITIADVCQTATAEQHKQLVRLWAASVWAAWSPHHPLIHSWLPILK